MSELKYLKYKSKYLFLKKITGGCKEITDNISSDAFFSGYEYVSKIETAERGGSVHIIKKEEKEYILKIIEGSTNEIEIQTIASELGAGPRIINSMKKKCDSDGKEYTYIIMEKLNKTLKQYVLELEEPKNLPEELQDKIIEVFSKLHSNNILHCDATSSNWMFDGSNFNTLVLIDFGDSEKKASLTQAERKADMDFLRLSLIYSAKLPEAKFNETKIKKILDAL